MFSNSALAVIGLAALANAHIVINTPKPFSNITPNNNGPLAADGSDYPCKYGGTGYPDEAGTPMALGSTQPLAFTGTAVHGGGSCQISITYDKAPTKQSQFKVIKSFVGGCPFPGTNENLPGDSAKIPVPKQFNFAIPDDLPTGDAVLSWTWHNNVGNREMYMNCAPITLTAKASKRADEEDSDFNSTQLVQRDVAAYNALPDMYFANIPEASSANCDHIDHPSGIVHYPNPGSVVEEGVTAAGAQVINPKGPCTNIFAKGGAPATGPPASSAPVAVSPSKPSSAAAAPPGGVFVTQAPPAAPTATPKVVATPAPIASDSPVPAAPVATSSPVAAPNPVAIPAAPVATASPSTGSGTTNGGGAVGAFAVGTSCTAEGQWNCIGGTSFQRCASGTWSSAMAVAAGTSCVSGVSDVISMKAAVKAKRSVRFSHEHRRHLHRSN